VSRGSNDGAYPYPLLDVRRYAGNVHPQYTHAAGIRNPQAFQYLGGSCLTGTIGTEHAEDFTLLYLKTDIIYGTDCTVHLNQVLNLDYHSTTPVFEH